MLHRHRDESAASAQLAISLGKQAAAGLPGGFSKLQSDCQQTVEFDRRGLWHPLPVHKELQIGCNRS